MWLGILLGGGHALRSELENVHECMGRLGGTGGQCGAVRQEARSAGGLTERPGVGFPWAQAEKGHWPELWPESTTDVVPEATVLVAGRVRRRC